MDESRTPLIVEHASREDVAAAIATGSAAVADVLPRVAYEQQHIPGSVSLPLAEIPDRAASVLPDRSAPVIVYCAGAT